MMNFLSKISFLLFIFTIATNCLLAQEKYKDLNLSFEERADDLISRMTLEEKAKQMVHFAEALPKLGIEKYNWWNECLHGVARAGRATIYPQAIGLAATFDYDLIFRVANSISDEARAMFNAAQERKNFNQYTGLTFWTPNVNIFRDPRWGRGQETYGEDPFLSGYIGSAFVKGLQGNNPKYLKVAACAKHFAVHSGPEADRHTFNAIASKKDLYETYLPAFKTLVDNNVEIVMCAYNRTNDEPCCGSKALLTQILRTDWGFKGHIVSDCGAIADIHKNHKYTYTPEESTALAIKESVNLNCGSVYLNIPEAVNKGLITETDVNKALKPLLLTRFKVGMMDPPANNPYSSISQSVINCEAHKKLAREVAAKSVVLLKNKNNVLPLKKDIVSLYITGPNAGNVDVLMGNYYGVSGEMVTMLEGITGHLKAGGTVQYKHGILADCENKSPLDWAIGSAKSNDATIAVLGITPLIEGEEGAAIASDVKGDRMNLALPNAHINYLKELKKAAGNKPLILILTGGSPITLEGVEEIPDAILFVWYPGEQGGNGVADVIFGDVIPSGRLPITFPKSVTQLPDYADYNMKNRTYRYMEQDPLYPFGYGLSYTTFSYSPIKLSAQSIKKEQSLFVEVNISNTGNYEADEIVQLYITDVSASFVVPKSSLKSLQKIHLKPGENQTVKFEIKPEMIAQVNNEGKSIIEKGEFKVYIGGSSPCNRSKELGVASVEAIFNVK